MKALFCMDMLKNESDELMERLNKRLRPSPDIRAFYVSLIKGVINNKPQIDQTIEQFSSNWKISRMGYVDRNILRIATYELMFCPDIPPKVTINEAVDIGKLYGTEDSGAFINGILDGIYQKKSTEVQKINPSD